MLLNRKQAEAVLAAGRALEPIDGRLQCEIPLAGTVFIEVYQPYEIREPENREISVVVTDPNSNALSDAENYDTWEQFAVAYGLELQAGA